MKSIELKIMLEKEKNGNFTASVYHGKTELVTCTSKIDYMAIGGALHEVKTHVIKNMTQEVKHD